MLNYKNEMSINYHTNNTNLSNLTNIINLTNQ